MLDAPARCGQYEIGPHDQLRRCRPMRDLHGDATFVPKPRQRIVDFAIVLQSHRYADVRTREILFQRQRVAIARLIEQAGKCLPKECCTSQIAAPCSPQQWINANSKVDFRIRQRSERAPGRRI
ncbi:hypothetical protein M2333_002282 [Sphingobium sp. B11D3B]|nr:hypothetical protein [Sphingobium sp. B11D3B]MCW2389236.1 hypothetical protein [Sphingobium sp. B11D3B]